MNKRVLIIPTEKLGNPHRTHYHHILQGSIRYIVYTLYTKRTTGSTPICRRHGRLSSGANIRSTCVQCVHHVLRYTTLNNISSEIIIWSRPPRRHTVCDYNIILCIQIAANVWSLWSIRSVSSSLGRAEMKLFGNMSIA